MCDPKKADDIGSEDKSREHSDQVESALHKKKREETNNPLRKCVNAIKGESYT